MRAGSDLSNYRIDLITSLKFAPNNFMKELILAAYERLVRRAGEGEAGLD